MLGSLTICVTTKSPIPSQSAAASDIVAPFFDNFLFYVAFGGINGNSPLFCFPCLQSDSHFIPRCPLSVFRLSPWLSPSHRDVEDHSLQI